MKKMVLTSLTILMIAIFGFSDCAMAENSGINAPRTHQETTNSPQEILFSAAKQTGISYSVLLDLWQNGSIAILPDGPSSFQLRGLSPEGSELLSQGYSHLNNGIGANISIDVIIDVFAEGRFYKAEPTFQSDRVRR